MFCAIWVCGPAAGPNGVEARRSPEGDRQVAPRIGLDEALRRKVENRPLLFELAEHAADQDVEGNGSELDHFCLPMRGNRGELGELLSKPGAAARARRGRWNDAGSLRAGSPPARSRGGRRTRRLPSLCCQGFKLP